MTGGRRLYGPHTRSALRTSQHDDGEARRNEVDPSALRRRVDESGDLGLRDLDAGLLDVGLSNPLRSLEMRVDGAGWQGRRRRAVEALAARRRIDGA
jgi:hypothetical protein